MQPTLKSFQITAQSALSTLQILDRQGRQDARKVTAAVTRIVQILTSREAVQMYRMTWNALTIAGMIAIALGMSAREWCDVLVENSLVQPSPEAVEPEAEQPTIAVPVVADPWADAHEVPAVEPSYIPQLAIVRSNLLCLPAAQPLLCLPSARITTPTPQQNQSKAEGKAPSQTTQLRRECTAKGVAWRNANGRNKHMTVKQMQQALNAIAA
jgi:hypothetical protein